MLDSGVRIAELVGIAVDHLDFEMDVAHVTGKGRRGRAAPFGTRTAEALRRYLRIRNKQRNAALPQLWISNRGPMTTSGVRQMLAALLARSGPQDEPPWIYWFTEANIQGIAGRSLLALGKPAEAEPHLRAMVAMLDPNFTRDRALWMCDLATARISAGSIDQGCATATEAAAVIRRLDSPRDKCRLAKFRQAAAPYAKTTAVRDFDSKYRDLTASSSA